MLLDKLFSVWELGIGGDPFLDTLRNDLVNVGLGHASVVFLLFLLGVLGHLRSVFHRPEALAKLVVLLSDLSEIIAFEWGDSQGELVLKVRHLHEICKLEEPKSFAAFFSHTLQGYVVFVCFLFGITCCGGLRLSLHDGFAGKSLA